MQEHKEGSDLYRVDENSCEQETTIEWHDQMTATTVFDWPSDDGAYYY